MPDTAMSLSENQKGIFFLHQINGADSANNLPGAVMLRGELDLARLQAAVDRIIREQSALRMSFHLSNDGQIEAAVSGECASTVAIENYEGCFHEKSVETHLDELIFAEASRPFDLTAAPLFRLRVLKIAHQRYMLLVTMHHIISDGWSLDVFKENLLRYYNDPDAPGKLQTCSYRDFITAEEELLRSEKGALIRDYWMKQLRGVLPLELPTDFPRTATKNYEGARISFDLDREVVVRLKKFARAERATLFMVLLSMFQILMHKYTGARDVVIATPIAGRLKSGFEALIGFFVNNLPMRACVDPEYTARGFIQANKKVIIESYKHQEYPYGRMVKDLGLFTNIEKFPISDVSFGFDVINQDSITQVQFNGLETEELEQKKIFVPGELLMFMVESEDRLIGNVEYNTGLFSSQTIHALIRRYRTLIANLLETPDSRIADISMLDAGDEQEVRGFSRGDTLTYDASRSVHDRIFQNCRLHPGRPAVCSKTESLTYNDLEEMSFLVAENLRHIARPRSRRIGIIPARRVELIPVLLGILKAGYACVPLAPELPPERLDVMLEDCGVDLLVSDITPPLKYSGPCCRIEELLVDVRLRPDGEEDQPCEETAFILFTSGTTGGPKGVPLRHESLTAYFEAAKKTFRLREGIGMLSIATVSFDMFVWEVVVTLLSGCTLVIADDDEQLRGSALASLHAAHPFESILSTPTRFRVLANDPAGAAVLSKMKLLMLGGEQIPLDLLTRLRETTTALLFNLYGPTEITFNATVRDLRTPAGLNIGKPMPGCEVHILSPEKKLVPVGIPGEIYIGGPGVSRGYLNRPELTAERFVELEIHPGLRFYRTGDFGKWLPDGSIAFLGRRDHQVKINGYRIETEEIEQHIKEIPGITDAKVVLRHAEARDFLCAFYTSNVENEERLVRKHLFEKVPGYMVPEQVVRLQEMPVNQNGKIDILRLPQSVVSARGPEGYVAPVTELEKLLCDIWRKVLHTETVGVNDDFFELGGDSIKAIQILTLMNLEGIDLKLHDMYQLRTVAQVIRHTGDGRKFTDTGRANAFFDSEFGGSNVQLVNSGQGYVLVAACEGIVGEKLYRIINTRLGDEIFPYGYVVPGEGETESEAIGRLVSERKTTLSEQEREGFLAEVRAAWKKVERSITQGEVIRSFDMSPIQKAHAMLPYRLCGNSLTIPFAGTPDAVIDAIKTLIVDQQMLHTTWEKSLPVRHWVEHEVGGRIADIPCLDLSSWSEEIRGTVCDHLVRKFLFGKQTFGAGPLYRLFLVRCTAFMYMLYIVTDHIIFDLTSSEIIRKRITDILSGRASHSRSSYTAYISDLALGPVGVSEEEIIERLDLSSLKPVTRGLRKLLRTSTTKGVICLDRELSINGSLSEQDIWSLSFDYCCRLFFDLFPFDSLPINIVYHGRKYGSNVYYDQVGEYLDIIPLIVRREVERPSVSALDMMQFITSHAVNFAALAFDREIGKKYRRVKKLLPGPGRDMAGILGFNFEGKFNEQERNTIRKMALIRLENQDDAGSMYRGVYFDAMYDENRLKFSVYFFDPCLRERIESRMNVVVAQAR